MYDTSKTSRYRTCVKWEWEKPKDRKFQTTTTTTDKMKEEEKKISQIPRHYPSLHFSEQTHTHIHNIQ